MNSRHKGCGGGTGFFSLHLMLAISVLSQVLPHSERVPLAAGLLQSGVAGVQGGHGHAEAFFSLRTRVGLALQRKVRKANPLRNVPGAI